MAASEIAFGEDYPATRTTQPPATTRPAQLSGEAFGEGTEHGFTALLPKPKYDFTHGG